MAWFSLPASPLRSVRVLQRGRFPIPRPQHGAAPRFRFADELPELGQAFGHVRRGHASPGRLHFGQVSGQPRFKLAQADHEGVEFGHVFRCREGRGHQDQPAQVRQAFRIRAGLGFQFDQPGGAQAGRYGFEKLR